MVAVLLSTLYYLKSFWGCPSREAPELIPGRSRGTPLIVIFVVAVEKHMKEEHRVFLLAERMCSVCSVCSVQLLIFYYDYKEDTADGAL